MLLFDVFNLIAKNFVIIPFEYFIASKIYIFNNKTCRKSLALR